MERHFAGFPQDFFPQSLPSSTLKHQRHRGVVLPRAKLPAIQIRGDETPNFPGNKALKPLPSLKKVQSYAGFRMLRLPQSSYRPSALASPKPGWRLPPILQPLCRKIALETPQIASARVSSYRKD